jgi:hypothetical protein
MALTMNKGAVDEFELVENQLERFRVELQVLAKAKPHDAVNAFKLSLLNALLARANGILGERYEAVAGFKQFDSDTVPTTSDSVLVVSQYCGALEKLRSDNIARSGGEWVWVIDGDISKVKTPAPAKLRPK